jgi:hypothetical protein
VLRYGFNRLYKELLKVYSEDNVAGAGGVFGDAGSMGFGGAVPGGEDFYAPGDARNVTNMGTTSRAGKVKTKNDKKKKKKKSTKKKK